MKFHGEHADQGVDVFILVEADTPAFFVGWHTMYVDKDEPRPILSVLSEWVMSGAYLKAAQCDPDA